MEMVIVLAIVGILASIVAPLVITALLAPALHKYVRIGGLGPRASPSIRRLPRKSGDWWKFREVEACTGEHCCC
jgi:hypothetical protein